METKLLLAALCSANSSNHRCTRINLLLQAQRRGHQPRLFLVPRCFVLKSRPTQQFAQHSHGKNPPLQTHV